MEKDLIQIQIGKILLEGNLNIPLNASGLVIFVHGSGSSRHSPRNQFVAQVLHEQGIATLLIDLLTVSEEKEDSLTGHLRFDIELLARRVIGITEWVLQNPKTLSLKIGYFGASTGGAAALVAAAEKQAVVKAVVSRGGRPDLAASSLAKVKAPTLLIVGGSDIPVIQMNEQALQKLSSEKKLAIVPQATHLFEEPGALEEVARLAAEWFSKFLQDGQKS
jgi:putative phosphoribosyl transferase